MQPAQRLSRAYVASLPAQQRADVEMPTPAMLESTERIVQFGTGGFLRGFVEFFVDAANRQGLDAGSVVAVASSASGRDAILNDQDGLFTLVTRGLEEGIPVERRRVIASLSRALSAADEWDEVLAVARDPNIALIFSNTTEIGIALDDEDSPGPGAPRSFPGKLTRFLLERAVAFDFAPDRGVVVLPCELIDGNGARLGALVRTLATRWHLDARFERWLGAHVRFCNTLVDRIVTGTPPEPELTEAAVRIGYRDELQTICEPYRLFAIEGDERVRSCLPFAGADRGIVVVPDISPFRHRKVRVLNGTHSVMAPIGLLAGLRTVGQATEDDRVGRFIRQVMHDEIVPALPVSGGEAFAVETLQRFANPFIHHALLDITLQATMKMRVRVVPSIIDHARRTGQAPAGLALGFAAYLLYRRGVLEMARREAGMSVPEDAQAAAVRAYWRGVKDQSPDAVSAMVDAVARDESLWGTDLTSVPGFVATVADHMTRACREGIVAALDAHLAAASSP